MIDIAIDGKLITTTPRHPFYVRGKGWTLAGTLEVGDEVSTSSCEWLSITASASNHRRGTAYNFHVGEYQTYFVSTEDKPFWIWVHNMCVNESPSAPREAAVTAEEEAWLRRLLQDEITKYDSVKDYLRNAPNADEVLKRLKLANATHAELAEHMGFRKTKFQSHGQAVYTDGKRYITPDVDSHIGGM